MSPGEEGKPVQEQPAPVTPRPWKDQAALTTVALCLFIASASWFLLRELAPVLRPLLLAILLCYVILPTHLRLKRRLPSLAAIAVLAGGTVAGLYLLALLLYGSAVQLSEDLPVWTRKIQYLLDQLQGWIRHWLPWLANEAATAGRIETRGMNPLENATNELVRAATDVLSESLLVGVYLLFLLLEVRRFPERVQHAFTGPRAEQILAVARNISDAMASYLKVKVKASLMLALPATLVLWALDVKFAVMWGILTFFANFIPYLGSIVACALPLSLAFLQMDFGWRPVLATVLLLGLHLSSAYLVEPRMTGRAVGLSPLMILLALAFWGLCWGLVGMVLAVPLTVMLKIVLDNVPFTRPVARLMGDE